MNVTIIYGTIIESSTYECVQLLLDDLKINSNVNLTEVFLQNKLPCFPSKDSKCFSNMNKSIRISSVYDIAKSINKSNLIILAFSISACDISAEMKSFLNDLSIYYMANESKLSESNTIGLVMSATSSAGLYYASKVLKKNLNFFGIKRVLGFSKTLYETDWEYINDKIKKHISKKVYKLSNKILNLYNNPLNNTFPIYLYNKISSKTDLKFNTNDCTAINLTVLKKTMPSTQHKYSIILQHQN